MEVGLEMRPIFVRKILYNTKFCVGCRNQAGVPKFLIQVSICVFGWDMVVGLEMRLIFVRKLLNNTKIGVGRRNKAGIRKFVIQVSLGVIRWNKAGIPKFVIQVYVGVCGYDMEVGLEMRSIFVRKLLNKIKFVI